MGVTGRKILKLLFLKSWATTVTSLLVAVVLTFALVGLATLAIPINVMGHDVSFFASDAMMGGHLGVVSAVLVATALVVIMFLLARIEGTGHNPGVAGGHTLRRITAGGHGHKPMVKMTMVWANVRRSFDRPGGHAFAV